MNKKIIVIPLIAIAVITGLLTVPFSNEEVDAQTPPADVLLVVGESPTGKRAVIDLIFQDDDYFELDGVSYNISVDKGGNKLDLINQWTDGYDTDKRYSATHESATIPQAVSPSDPLTITVFVHSSQSGAITHNFEKQFIITEPLIIPSVSINTFVDVQPNGIDFKVDVTETGQTGEYDILVTQQGTTLYEVYNWHNEPWGVNPFPHWTDELVALPSESSVVIRVTPEHGQILNQIVNTDPPTPGS